MVAAKELAGLPTYGPRALSFPDPGAFREGLVIEFATDDGGAWVGNFARFDENGLDAILLELGAHSAVIVAGSAGYIMDVRERRMVREMSFGIEHVWFDKCLQAMIVTNGLWFEAFTANQTLWRSRRLSWDGVRKLDQIGLKLTGEALDPSSGHERWLPFQLDLSTGVVSGGAYPAEL